MGSVSTQRQPKRDQKELLLTEGDIKSLIPQGNNPPRLSRLWESLLRRDWKRKEESMLRTKLEIESLRSRLQDLESRADEMALHSQHYRRIFDPVRVIPIEILQQIFSCSREIQTLYGETDSLDVKSDPWRVAQVSQKWRAAALGYPALWNTLSIHFLSRSVKRKQSRSLLLAMVLFHAGSSALHVALSSKVCIEETHPLLAHLMGSAKQWKSLTVNLLAQNFLVLTNLRPNLQFLDSFTFIENLNPPPKGWIWRGAPSVADLSLLLCQQSSRLRKLCIIHQSDYRGDGLQVTRAVENLCLPQLDELRIESNAVHEQFTGLTSVLKSAPLLRKIQLCGASASCSTLVSFLSRVHRLRCLEIETDIDSSAIVEEFMEKMSATPKLLSSLRTLVVKIRVPKSLESYVTFLLATQRNALTELRHARFSQLQVTVEYVSA